MIPLGYLAKRVPKQCPHWLKAPNVIDVYSVSDCVNDTLADYSDGWKHNGFWMFDCVAAIQTAAEANEIDMQGAMLFFYEACESEFDGNDRHPISPEAAFETQVVIPPIKRLEGFDVVTFCDGPNSHSPLSCNGIAADIKTNKHCLLESLDVESAFSQTPKDSLPAFRAVTRIFHPDRRRFDITSPHQAADIAATVIEAIRNARETYRPMGTIHLFMAVPVGLAMMIGQGLNTFGDVQTYEHIPTDGVGSYRAAARLQPSA